MQGTKSAQPKKLILATTLLSNSPHCSRSPYPGCELAEKHSASAAAPAPLLPPPAASAGSPPSAAGAGFTSPAAAVAGSREFLNPIAHEVVLKITSFGGCSGLGSARPGAWRWQRRISVRVAAELGVDLAKAATGRRARSSSTFLAAAQERAAWSTPPPRLGVLSASDLGTGVEESFLGFV
uniref:Uncharacterized protein n=1 Tax=Oryza rufipogon TaxID=4529 RepID=A0A0E0N157_ORYRU